MIDYVQRLSAPRREILLASGRRALALKVFTGIGLLAALISCSSVPSTPHALLDERTGVTTNVVGAPISFARVRNDVSGSARECLTLVAVERDVSGHYTDLLLVYRWTVVIRGDAPPAAAAVGPVKIRADEHEIDLQALPQIPIDMSQRDQLFMPVESGVAIAAYAADFNTLRLIATSHELTVSLPQQPLETPFSLWRDGRPALAQFVKQLNGS
jgi:hypothetical protein